MLYFAYGSNLHHLQMKKRCKDSIFLKKIKLKNFRLTFRNMYVDIEFKKNAIVTGALFEISKNDEKKLDMYEDYPIVYKKYYFTYYRKKVMTYTMTKKTNFTSPEGTIKFITIFLCFFQALISPKLTSEKYNSPNPLYAISFDFSPLKTSPPLTLMIFNFSKIIFSLSII